MSKKKMFASFSGFALLLALLAAYPADAGELPEGQASVVIPVTGMSCGSCCVKVETAVKELDGVVAAKADYEKGSASVTYVKDKVTVEKIVATINEKTSFKASMPEETG